MLHIVNAAELRGRCLRAWRTYSNLSEAELGQKIFLTGAAVSMIESGERGKRLVEVGDIIAPAFDLDHAETEAFIEMWHAIGSVTDGMPRTRWAHNYPLPSGPIWAWLRPPEGTRHLRASLWWGEPFQGRVEVDIDEFGIIITAPVSIPNPALEVELEHAGWVDFGSGHIPREVASQLGIVLRDGRTMLGTSPPTDPPATPPGRMLARALGQLRELATNLGIGWSILVPHLGMARSDRAPHAMDGLTVGATRWTGARELDAAGMLTSQLLRSPAQTRATRDARGYSRAQAAKKATEKDADNPIIEKHLETLETAGRLPTSANALARLDSVYGADGHLGVERTFDSRTDVRAKKTRDRYDVTFPAFWIGPIWLQAVGPEPGDIGIVDLVWAKWRRRQRVLSGTVLTTRRSEQGAKPLVVKIPPGWRVVAGTGASPAALDINHGWWPKNGAAAISLLVENIGSIRKAIDDDHDTPPRP